ncbi:MAG: DUF839 domain-containing protein [Bdellovibrionaceae bacterium]|nr:DUF839 domain-containing protein [Pseudobdellovibrionaceae bacterium]
MGRVSAGVALSGALLETACSHLSTSMAVPFHPLPTTTEDNFITADGFTADVLIRWRDPLNTKDKFGTNNDFLCFIPLNTDGTNALLWVNHEYMHPVLIHNRKMNSPRTKAEMSLEQLEIGGSLVEIIKRNGKWSYVPNSKYNRRITAQTKIPFQKNTRIMNATSAYGMVTNCSGGYTPWKTILTCEENYDIYYGNSTYINKKRQFVPQKKMNWYEHFNHPPEHYGWVVEVEPFTGHATKLITLGRFEHESATVTTGKSGKVVVYMGEDRRGGGIFKFVSDSGKNLDKGTLYVANTDKGQWIALDYATNPILKKHFNSQLEVLIYASYAAELVGGTAQDRPEDVEIDPITGAIVVALTNNIDQGNLYGSLLKIEEDSGDHESLTFKASTLMSGGMESGFACPDNMVFDGKGNLWMTSDMAEYDMRDGKYPGFGNNSLFYIPLKGPYAGGIYRVASAPCDAEFTGPTFSSDSKTLFLSVQHPGALTKDPSAPTSTWPDGPGQLPKSSVVAIQGPQLEKLTL